MYIDIDSVIVSQWVTMLNVVEHHLVKEGFRCCTIQGNVPVKLRSQIVDTFNSDPSGPTVSKPLSHIFRLCVMRTSGYVQCSVLTF